MGNYRGNLVGAKQQAKHDIKKYIDVNYPITTDTYSDNYNVRLTHIFTPLFTTQIK